MGKTTTLFLVLVLTLKSTEPELAQFCLDLSFPTVLVLGTLAAETWSHLGEGVKVIEEVLFVVG